MRFLDAHPASHAVGSATTLPLRRAPALALLARVVGRAVPIVLFGFMAAANLRRFLLALSQGAPGGDRLDVLAHYGLVAHSGLVAVFMGSTAALVLIRKEPVRKLPRLIPQGAALAGTWIVTVLGLQPPAPGAWWVPLVSSGLLVAGMACAVAALLVLGRCFGILPEARGLVTSGPYRYVRHPLYSAEALAFLGVLLPVLSPLSLAIYGLFLALQALRTRYEEEVLAAAFPEYDAYRRTTWRFVPGVF
jgi:protein-S-isoprenylcysteine O-methyltransferase Ste14